MSMDFKKIPWVKKTHIEYFGEGIKSMIFLQFMHLIYTF